MSTDNLATNDLQQRSSASPGHTQHTNYLQDPLVIMIPHYRGLHQRVCRWSNAVQLNIRVSKPSSLKETLTDSRCTFRESERDGCQNAHGVAASNQFNYQCANYQAVASKIGYKNRPKLTILSIFLLTVDAVGSRLTGYYLFFAFWNNNVMTVRR